MALALDVGCRRDPVGGHHWLAALVVVRLGDRPSIHRARSRRRSDSGFRPARTTCAERRAPSAEEIKRRDLIGRWGAAAFVVGVAGYAAAYCQARYEGPTQTSPRRS